MKHFPTIFDFNTVDSFDKLKVNILGKFLKMKSTEIC